MRAAVLFLAVATGCAASSTQTHARTRSPAIPRECRADSSRDVAAALVGIGLVGLGTAAMIQSSRPLDDVGGWLIVGGTITTITSTTSAIYGAIHGATCQRAEPPAPVAARS